MSDKTCGTCANGKPALVRCTVHGDEFPWLRKRNEACDDFCERADSLEAVALDAVRKLEKAAALIDVERWERIVHSQVDDLRVRLKALGVEP